VEENLIEVPTVFVLGGPNGSGKTSVWKNGFDHSIKFVNPDSIASEMNPVMPEKMAIAAGREVLSYFRQLKKNRKDFVIESTLSGIWLEKYLRDLKNDGFRIVIFFIWLENEELAVNRVRDRQKRGGHYVTGEDVRRRYFRSIYNMKYLYCPIANDWFFYDNSDKSPTFIAKKENKKLEIKNKPILSKTLKKVRLYEQSIKKKN
jgi:predicted ABC-type ATPase